MDTTATSTVNNPSIPIYRSYFIVDDREREVIGHLAKHPADIVPHRLDVADFLVSAECAVERKWGMI